MKTYLIAFSGAYEVEAENKEEALTVFHKMSNADVGEQVTNIDGIKEVK